MSSSGLNAVAIPDIRFNEVIEHLRFNFFADEPLNRGVDLCQKGDSHLELENHCLATLKQGYSRMLVTEDGTVIKIIKFNLFIHRKSDNLIIIDWFLKYNLL